jgi:hypothetical protein
LIDACALVDLLPTPPSNTSRLLEDGARCSVVRLVPTVGHCLRTEYVNVYERCVRVLCTAVFPRRTKASRHPRPARHPAATL